MLLFSSSDLLHWEYETVLFGGKEYADCIECPDFFRLGDKYVLMFSKIKGEVQSYLFLWWGISWRTSWSITPFRTRSGV